LYDHVLVDEAQDLHASQWRLLRAIVPEQPDDLFIVGDAMQRIYGDTVSLRALGIETRGRATRLRRNYRTTHEIVGWALGLVSADTVIDLDELGTDLSGYTPCGTVLVPILRPTSAGERADGVGERVGGWLAAGYGPESVAVAVRGKEDVARVVAALKRAGVPAAQLGREGRLDASVNVGYMHRLKGLEYACVAIVGLNEMRVPPPERSSPPEDDHTQHIVDLQTERSLIYVAATRARDHLAVSWHGQPTSLLRTRHNEVLNITSPLSRCLLRHERSGHPRRHRCRASRPGGVLRGASCVRSSGSSAVSTARSPCSASATRRRATTARTSPTFSASR
jgi:superfamily I DNA/RNA helicase